MNLPLGILFTLFGVPCVEWLWVFFDGFIFALFAKTRRRCSLMCNQSNVPVSGLQREGLGADAAIFSEQ